MNKVYATVVAALFSVMSVNAMAKPVVVKVSDADVNEVTRGVANIKSGDKHVLYGATSLESGRTSLATMKSDKSVRSESTSRFGRA